jgi:hypothetical protein
VGEDNAAPEKPATTARDFSRLTYIVIIGIAVIVWAAVAVFFLYTIRPRDYLSAQAYISARVFTTAAGDLGDN